MRYRYTSPSFNNFNKRINFSVPEGIKILLLVNIIIFFITELLGMKYEFFKFFGLVPKLTLNSYQIWQPITYMFLHSGFFHIFINMLVLWMFGRELEYRWGKKEFLILRI